MYSVRDFKHDIKHDRLMILLVFGTILLFFWLLIPVWILHKMVDAYKVMGWRWVLLTTVNLTASGIALSIWIPAIIKWSWCG